MPAEVFSLDRGKAVRELNLADGAISAVTSLSDADELNRLAEDSLDAGVVTAKCPNWRFSIYPMSLNEPDPLLAVDVGSGCRLLGFALKVRRSQFQNSLQFTLHILEEMVNEANALLSGPQTGKSQAQASKEAGAS